MYCVWQSQRCHPVEFLRVHQRCRRRGKSPSTVLSCFSERLKYYMYGFEPVKSRCIVYGNRSDAIRLSFCVFIKDAGVY